MLGHVNHTKDCWNWRMFGFVHLTGSPWTWQQNLVILSEWVVWSAQQCVVLQVIVEPGGSFYSFVWFQWGLRVLACRFISQEWHFIEDWIQYNTSESSQSSFPSVNECWDMWIIPKNVKIGGGRVGFMHLTGSTWISRQNLVYSLRVGGMACATVCGFHVICWTIRLKKLLCNFR